MKGLGSEGFGRDNLIREEVERTRADLAGKLGRAERSLLPLAGGGLVMLFGVQLLAYAGVLLLGQVMPLWVAAILLGGTSCGVGTLIMAVVAKRAIQENASTPSDHFPSTGSRSGEKTRAA